MIKRITRTAAVLLLSMLALGVAPVLAQGFKVGYTDHELIIVNMPEYKTIQELLQKEYQGGQQELQGMAQDYQDKLEKYQKQQALLSPERRQEREKELVDLQGQLQQKAQQREQALAAREAELMRPLFERVQNAIDDVSKAMGLDIVLRSQVGNQPVILYRNERTVVDITLDVAKRLGLNVNADSTAASR